MLDPIPAGKILLFKINQTNIYDDERLDFEAKEGVSPEEVRKWLPIMQGAFLDSKKNRKYNDLISRLREFHVLPIIIDRSNKT